MPENACYQTSTKAENHPKVEIGGVLESDLLSDEREAAREAADAMQMSLAACMQEFDWVIETLDHPSRTARGRIEPVRLLDAAESDHDLQGWDFVIVVTGRELRGRERSRVGALTVNRRHFALPERQFPTCSLTHFYVSSFFAKDGPIYRFAQGDLISPNHQMMMKSHMNKINATVVSGVATR